jgi:hypothetical protein
MGMMFAFTAMDDFRLCGWRYLVPRRPKVPAIIPDNNRIFADFVNVSANVYSVTDFHSSRLSG